MTDNFENLLKGGYSSLNPEYGAYSHVQFRLPAEKLASTTSIQTANQVAEVVSRIREGTRAVEIQQIRPEIFETIPKQQFEEIRAITKLSGVKTSFHAPVLDPAGFGEKGWTELERKENENRLFNVIERAHEVSPKENIPIVIHSSGGIPGTEWIKKGKVEVLQKIPVINVDTGQLVTIAEREEETARPEDIAFGIPKEQRVFTPTQKIDSLNRNEWDKQVINLITHVKQADELIGDTHLFLVEYLNQKPSEQMVQSMNPLQRTNYNKLANASEYLKEAQLAFSGSFEKAYKYGTDKQKEELTKLAKTYTQEMGNINENLDSIDKRKNILGATIQQFHNIAMDPKLGGPPKINKPVEEFAKQKAAETISNLAIKSVQKFEIDKREKSPVLAIENMWQGMAFGKAKDMADLIKVSRDKFVENAVKSKSEGGLGFSKGAAESKAKEIIGMTWDVGHLNLAKKAGYTDEDLRKETEQVAKLVKHIHLTDNFGHADTHLAPGMGNVPFKKILEELEKSGTLKKAMTVIEAGALTNPQMGLKMSPHKWVLSAFGSPIYGAKMASYWNQAADTQGNYFAFPIAYLPEKHFSMYGSGFSLLPQELGGQIPGTQSRFSGTENA